jgi:hypothetical protein
MKNSKLPKKVIVSKKVDTKATTKPKPSTQKRLVKPQLNRHMSKKLGIIDDIGKIVELGVSAVDTVVSTVENPIDGIINKLPNTVAKFADAMGGHKVSLDPKAPGQVSINGPIDSGSKEEKFIDNLKKEIPVIQTQGIPSSFASDYKAPPVTTKDITYQGVNCLKVSGSVVLSTLVVPATTGLNRIQTRPLNPQIFGGQLGALSNLYQRHLWMNVAMFYIPNCPTTASGNVILTFQNSPNTSYTATTAINSLSQRDLFSMGSVYKGLTLPLIGQFKQQYNLPNAGSSSDIRFFADWAYEIWCYAVGGNPGDMLGTYGLTYDIILFSRIEADNIVLSMFDIFKSCLQIYTGLDESKCMNLVERLVSSYSEIADAFIDRAPDIKVVKRCLEYLPRSEVYETEERISTLVGNLLGWEDLNPSRLRFLSGLGYSISAFWDKIYFFKYVNSQNPAFINFLDAFLEYHASKEGDLNLLSLELQQDK